MIDSGAFEKLLALGRSKGGLDTEDIRRALPVAQMSPEDIALVLVHIEEAGVPVEVEDSLLTGAAERAAFTPGAAPPPVIDLPGAASPPAPGSLAGSAGAMGLATGTTAWPGASDATPAAAHVPPPQAAHWAIGAAALLLVLICAALFVMFR